MTIAERLDILPFSRAHWQFVSALGLVWSLAGVALGVVPFVLAPLAEQWSLSRAELGMAASVGLLGMALGGSAGGYLGDRLGRRPVIIWSVVAFSVCTGLSGLAWNYHSLLVLRFIAGVALSAAFPVGGALSSELSPARQRGSLVFILEIFFVSGTIVAAVLALFVIPAWGWRAALFLGVVPILYAPVLYRLLPESPRFLSETGRQAEAERIVAQFEWHAGVSSPPTRRRAPDPTAVANGGFRSLWRRPLVRRTILLWSVWFGLNFFSYGFTSWLPTLLVARGFSMANAFTFALIFNLAQLPGCFIGGLLIERVGRKWTLVGVLLSAGVASFMWGHTMGSELLIWGCLMLAFNTAAWVVMYTYGAELYPTRVRGVGSGTSQTFGRFGGFVAPFLFGLVLGWGETGYALLFILLAALLVSCGVVVASLGEETKGKSLEQITLAVES